MVLLETVLDPENGVRLFTVTMCVGKVKSNKSWSIKAFTRDWIYFQLKEKKIGNSSYHEFISLVRYKSLKLSLYYCTTVGTYIFRCSLRPVSFDQTSIMLRSRRAT